MGVCCFSVSVEGDGDGNRCCKAKADSCSAYNATSYGSSCDCYEYIESKRIGGRASLIAGIIILGTLMLLWCRRLQVEKAGCSKPAAYKANTFEGPDDALSAKVLPIDDQQGHMAAHGSVEEERSVEKERPVEEERPKFCLVELVTFLVELVTCWFCTGAFFVGGTVATLIGMLYLNYEPSEGDRAEYGRNAMAIAWQVCY